MQGIDDPVCLELRARLPVALRRIQIQLEFEVALAWARLGPGSLSVTMTVAPLHLES